MKILTISLSTLLLLIVPFAGFCQSVETSLQTEENADKYQNCAAIIFNGEMLVDDYSPRGICQLNQSKRGKITVSTVELSSDGGEPQKDIGFQIAIRNTATNTLWMFSKKTTRSIMFEDILAKCQPGDQIVFMTVDQEYALPHNEIEIDWQE
jgi:hypothetical protein